MNDAQLMAQLISRNFNYKLPHNSSHAIPSPWALALLPQSIVSYERMKSFTTSAKCKHRGQFKMRTPMHASIPHRSGLFENAYGKKIAIRQNNYLSFEMWIQSKCSLHGFFTSEFCVGDGYIWSDISASIHRNSCSSNAKNGDHVEHRWNVVSKPTIQALHCS